VRRLTVAAVVALVIMGAVLAGSFPARQILAQRRATAEAQSRIDGLGVDIGHLQGRVDALEEPEEIKRRISLSLALAPIDGDWSTYATFVGTLNTLNATVLNVADRSVAVDGQAFQLAALPPGAAANAPLALTMRPEAVSLGKPNGQDVVLQGRVAEVSFLGSVIRLKVDLGQNMLSLDTFNDTHTPPPALDQRIEVSLNSSDILILPN